MEKLAALGPEMQTMRVGATVAPRKFSLEHIRAMLKELGQPQMRFPSVLIAGTNGKGSTAATLAAIAHAAGIKTALYTSPHLVRVSERIRVSSAGEAGANGLEEIGEEAFARNYFRVDVAAQALVERGELPHEPSYFEVMTAVAFCWFAEQRVELAVLEVGLGGRLDATNSVEPLVSVITDIAIDHTQYLGNTLREIAGEKAGILRENGVLVTLAQHPEANAAIGEAAVRLSVRGVDAARCLPAAQRTANSKQLTAQGEAGSLLVRNRYELLIGGEVLQVDSPLAGQHQQRNIALAIATAMELRRNHGFVIPNAAIEVGIRATEWPGRLEWVASASHAPVLLDVAHNPAGAWALRAALAQLPDEMPRTLIFSCLSDKPIEELAQVLLPLFDSASGDPARAQDHVILAPIQNPRAASMEDLLAAAAKLEVPAEGASDLAAALAHAAAVTPKDGVIVATGSVFLVGEIRSQLMAGRTS
jgi:dihydrofolate synthase/folylpolyglutamate synthase